MALHTFRANNLLHHLLLTVFFALPPWASVLPIEVLPSEAIEPCAEDSGMDVCHQLQYEDGTAFCDEHAALVNIHRYRMNVTAEVEGLEKCVASVLRNRGPHEPGYTYAFQYSRCDFERGIRPYCVVCSKTDTVTGVVGDIYLLASCGQNEDCVDSLLAIGQHHTFCLPRTNFRRVSVVDPRVQLQDVIKPHRVPSNEQIQVSVTEASSVQSLVENLVGIRSRDCAQLPTIHHCSVLAKAVCSKCSGETLAPTSPKSTSIVVVVRCALQTAVNIYIATLVGI